MASPIVACPSCGTKNRVPVSADGHPRCAACKADLPWLVDADDVSFAAAIRTRQLVLVDLWAPWCGPCRMVAPILEQLARDHAGEVKVVKVDVDGSPGVARTYRATSIPMMLFVRGGEVVETVIGAHPEHVMRAKVQHHLAAH